MLHQFIKAEIYGIKNYLPEYLIYIGVIVIFLWLVGDIRNNHDKIFDENSFNTPNQQIYFGALNDKVSDDHHNFISQSFDSKIVKVKPIYRGWEDLTLT